MTDAGGWFWRTLKHWASQLAFRSQGGAGVLTIAARLDLGGKKSLLLVAYGERRFLLAHNAETLSAPVEIRAERGAARLGTFAVPPGPKARRAAGRRLRGVEGARGAALGRAWMVGR